MAQTPRLAARVPSWWPASSKLPRFWRAVSYLPAINALAIALLMVRSNSPASINQPKSLA
jgi:hypothetical protein